MKKNILPGFGITMGITTLYVSLFVLVPISLLLIKTASLSLDEFITIVTNERVMHAYKVSLTTAFIAAFLNAIFGLLLAWVLVRYRFPGRRIIDGLIDLPFALPTAVAGMTLAALYGPEGWFGQFFQKLGIPIAYTSSGIVIALMFIGLPFVVRMVQPVLENLPKETEEAAASLGASRFQTFHKVIFPEIVPALLAGFSLALARGLGEYGSVVFIAGNMPMKTEVAPLLIMSKLEQFDYAGATAIGVVMLLLSFTFLIIINILQKWHRKHELR
ncbi:MAG TPA: sulfate ABC transporter permease subunit CysT [Metalysinibacillus jejuensis]|uniref:Sulfate transport system permease protein CysT n=1 Tax=Metalysinibacillus jejuensis TaxID=914327 RepID=A0A921NB32_9BACL|nr:sulfate ABC transporter permease subunit CysT [Metalysinibacillus jejuensis]